MTAPFIISLGFAITIMLNELTEEPRRPRGRGIKEWLRGKEDNEDKEVKKVKKKKK